MSVTSFYFKYNNILVIIFATLVILSLDKYVFVCVFDPNPDYHYTYYLHRAWAIRRT